jgi:CRISPR-associated protein Cmr6
MKNLSWLFYKGYYKDFTHWSDRKSNEVIIKKEINDFFKGINRNFTHAKLTNFKNVTPPAIAKDGFELTTTYPGLLMGSGYAHGIGAIGEFKIGFQLDYETGLPVIPGSSVKGVLRSVFPSIKYDEKTSSFSFYGDNVREILREEVKANWILTLLDRIENQEFLKLDIQPEPHDLQNYIEYLYCLIREIFEGVKDFKEENPAYKYYSIYNRNIFFEAIPISSNHGGLIYGDDSITHHPDPLKDPNPLLFLKVLPEVCYRFNFKIIPSKVEHKLDVNHIILLFKKIILTIGIGAKTNVGYGQFKIT